MYYKSQNKQELEAYNERVSQGEGYQGITTKWSSIIEHQNGVDFAIVKNEKYLENLTEIDSLDGWFTETQI